MKANKLSLGLCSLLLLATVAKAQNPAEYVKWQGENDKFYQAYGNWSLGKALYPSVAEDENFFISRIKPRKRFRNAQTQVDKNLSEELDKNVLNWVPIGSANDGNSNALPSGRFDSDVFSMWSYLTHYGNWTAPLVRVPAAFMDVAHKNGVSISALASIPWSESINAYDQGHGQNLASLYDGGAEKFIQFLKYYGIDGWGMNSEFSTTSTFAHRLQDFMGDVYAKAITEKEWPSYSAVWYTLVGNNGSLSATNGLTNSNIFYYHKNGRPISNYVFGNYHWASNNGQQLQLNDQLTKEKKRDPREIYGGMNLQGAQGRAWSVLKKYKSSIGLWGAHNENIFYESRAERGSSNDVKQATYLGSTERFFSNGNQNPADKLSIKDMLTTSYDGLRHFHGVSALSTAKSVLSWDLDEEPFFTFFNLGNGKFFNLEGKEAFFGEWYNLGMQDYLPTWRYWFSEDFLGSQVATNGLKATFTWDDAWFGGSCMKIYGQTSSEYLHLFKTKLALKEGDKIRLRYKVLSGTTDIKLVASAEGAEGTVISAPVLKSSKLELGEWVETIVEVQSSGRNALKLVDKTMAVAGLQFENANNLELLLGEFSILRKQVDMPEKPRIKQAYTKVLKRTYKGLDAKVIFEMPVKTGAVYDADHVYNSDVKTSFFKVYVKQDGKESFVTATTSWAALLFSAPYNPKGTKAIQIGVSAVGLDGVTESEITWSDELEVKDDLLSIDETLVIDKATIKPNQDFTVKFEDPNHAEATSWEILNSTTKEVVKTFTGGRSFTYKLDKIGLYDLKLVFDGKEKIFPSFISISSLEVGAVPEIKEFTLNNKEVEQGKEYKQKVDEVMNFAYKGAKADGVASRGLNLRENPLSVDPASVGVTSKEQSWTISFWIKFEKLVKGETQLLNIRNLSGGYPANAWGYVWSDYNTNNNTYKISLRCNSSNRGYQQYYQNFNINPKAWTHFTYQYIVKNGLYNMKLYINGKYLPSDKWDIDGGGLGAIASGTGEGPGFNDMFNWQSKNRIMVGGFAKFRAGADGVVDDFKFFNRTLTDEEVLENMYSEKKYVNGLTGYWNFENDVDENAVFASVSKVTGAKLIWGQQVAGTAEGSSSILPRTPSFEAGCPFLTGDNFKVVTKPTWLFKKANITDKEGTDQVGTATMSYRKDGVYSGKLILSNSWGKAERVIDVITIGSGLNALEELTDEVSLQAFPNPFIEQVNLHFAENGQYVIGIYDLSGKLVSRKVLNAEAGSVVAINVDAPQGIYLLRVLSTDGKLLRTIKLQKK